ncbi:MAG: hypothetical protein QOE77_1546 [Blastocatellia bacterium]|jgi:hypothetical protein|nr:hypothetical protein [Blastocatellia bacterium]
MTVTAGPDVFKTETVGYATQTVTLQSTHQYFLAPQNTGFHIGTFGFNANETERLGRAYDKINSDECRRFYRDSNSRVSSVGAGERKLFME